MWSLLSYFRTPKKQVDYLYELYYTKNGDSYKCGVIAKSLNEAIEKLSAQSPEVNADCITRAVKLSN